MKALIRGRKADSNVSIIKDIVLVLLIIALCIGVYLIFIKPLRGGKEEFIDPYKICFGRKEGSICNLNNVKGTCQNGMCVATDKPAYSRDEAIGIFKTTFENKMIQGQQGQNVKTCQKDAKTCENATQTLKNILAYTKFEEEESQTFIFVRSDLNGHATFMLSDRGTFWHAINPEQITNQVMASFEYPQEMCLYKRVDEKNNEEVKFLPNMIIGIAKQPDGYYIFQITSSWMGNINVESRPFISLRHKNETDASTPLCIYYQKQ
jgi:hypothetical protein